MIVNEHITDYIASLDADMTPELSQLEQWALETQVPIIRHDTQMYLGFLLRKEKPKAILEIGTAVGFSTLFIHEYAPKDAHITTIEKVEMRLVHARRNLAGHERIRLIEGDAGEVLKELAAGLYTAGPCAAGAYAAGTATSASNGSCSDAVSLGGFDLIFLDAAKGQYLSWLPDILRLLKPDGLLLTDNVLLEGSIAESKFAIERRDRTIHMRMREFLHEITHCGELDTVILPIGDGLAVSRRVTKL